MKYDVLLCHDFVVLFVVPRNYILFSLNEFFSTNETNLQYSQDVATNFAQKVVIITVNFGKYCTSLGKYCTSLFWSFLQIYSSLKIQSFMLQLCKLYKLIWLECQEWAEHDPFYTVAVFSHYFDISTSVIVLYVWFLWAYFAASSVFFVKFEPPKKLKNDVLEKNLKRFSLFEPVTSFNAIKRTREKYEIIKFFKN